MDLPLYSGIDYFEKGRTITGDAFHLNSTGPFETRIYFLTKNKSVFAERGRKRSPP